MNGPVTEMKKAFLCASLAALVGCGGAGAPGAAGAAGAAGTDGKNGTATLLSITRSDSLPGCNGGSGITVVSYVDADGSGTLTPGDPILSQAVVCDGATGAAGPQGDAGTSCTVETVDPDPNVAPNGGALITCGSTSTLVLNGAPGPAGPQGDAGVPAPPTAYSVVNVIDPCGPSGGADEVFLQLANGTVVASFSDNAAGQNTRLSILNDGTYETSDGTNCIFTVSTNTQVTPNTRSITWPGGGETWTMSP
jgi:pilus assembly protein FimV